jgi:hypothetical protein
MKIDDSTTRDNMLNQIDDALGPTAYARFQNSAQTATYTKIALETPDPFAAASGGSMALDVTPVPESTGTPSVGTVGAIGFYTAKTAGTLICSFGVATSGSPDITMPDNTLETTDTVQITSLTITMPTGTLDTT